MKKNLFTILLLCLMIFSVSCGVNAFKPEDQVNKNYSTGKVTSIVYTDPNNQPIEGDSYTYTMATVTEEKTIVAVTYINQNDTDNVIPNYKPVKADYKPISFTFDRKTQKLTVTGGSFDGTSKYVFKVYVEIKDVNVSDVVKTKPTYEGSYKADGTTDYKLPAKTDASNKYIVQEEAGYAKDGKWVSKGWKGSAPSSEQSLVDEEKAYPQTPVPNQEGRKFRVWIYKK